MHTALTASEHTELTCCEQTIERGLTTFIEVGNAFLGIRDKRLYRETYSTFEDYCRQRWGMSRIHAYRLMEAAQVVGNLSPIGNTLPSNESQARLLARLSSDQQREVWQQVMESAPDGKVTAEYIQTVVRELTKQPGAPEPHQLINSSTSNEWYTPAPILEAAREVMGVIELDPASNTFANQTVQAKQFYTIEDDGLTKPWYGRVWLNPPYGRTAGESNQAMWSKRLVAEYQAGNVAEAILLVNAATGNGWFTPLKDFPICFPDDRIHFYNSETEASQPTQSNALVYFGDRAARFVQVFSCFGAAMAKVIVQNGALRIGLSEML